MATPRASDPHGAPAGLLRRLAAMVYDGLLVLAIWMVTLLAMVLANGGEAVFGALVQSVLFLETFVFFAWFWLLCSYSSDKCVATV